MKARLIRRMRVKGVRVAPIPAPLKLFGASEIEKHADHGDDDR
jgi:hypothetical protein